MLYLKRTLGKLLIFVVCFRRIVCLSSPSTSSSPPLRIISLNINGGNVRYFDLVDDSDDNVNCPSGGGNVDDKTMFHSIIKDPIFVVRTLKRHIFTVMRSTLAKTFLPTGFPGKTPPNYLRFSFWSWIQDVSTQLRSVLATQRILEGVGVGSSEATALSALFNYLVRDGCGMAAGKGSDRLIALRKVSLISNPYTVLFSLTILSLLFSRTSIYICCLISISYRF